jgi:hypothetical protein
MAYDAIALTAIASAQANDEFTRREAVGVERIAGIIISG